VTDKAAGLSGAAGGVLGVVLSSLTIAYPPAVAEGTYSYPYPASLFVITQILLFFRDIGVAILLTSLRLPNRVGDSRLGRISARCSALGMLCLATLEGLSLAITDPAAIGAAYGLASFAVGAFTTLAGIAVLRAKLISGWHRYLPLAAGLFVFVPMTPAIMAGFVPGQLALATWMALFALLGRAIQRTPIR